ncbi:folylpolyglutamate synthase [cyanobacterium endosymbiont of Braarudosphaera bigelowii]|uniref:tetrahydrofolate synthase n=2 Tax=Candidatus Atelocyanobacterium thalassae TaxID=713887 RepID=A0ABN6JZ49_9CHRO|nr:folylpolyglutamate synthase [cyanobacterium endosymbiont of Braarudosphaera bigelowii]
MKNMSIDSLLLPFQRFGVHLGLERINTLLTKLANPHHDVPIIHVGGSNGKGSVCAYLSSILMEAGYKVGRYTSPHLIDWTERICLNNKPIPKLYLREILLSIQDLILNDEDLPTQFEVITAAALTYFKQEKVDIIVMEVGLGGRLDATNICQAPLATVITSISLEHCQNLGPTITDIAREKSGIFKPNCPVVIGEVPHEAKDIFTSQINTLNCPSVWVQSATLTQHNSAIYKDIEYPLSLSGEVQLSNSAISIEVIKILKQKGWNIPINCIKDGIQKTSWRGRLEWLNWQSISLLVDGAHNPDAARQLRNYINNLNKSIQSITWIIGIINTKEHDKIFKELLRDNETLYLVPVPEHDNIEPKNLLSSIINSCVRLREIRVEKTLDSALKLTTNKRSNDNLVVLCGSLYLVGYLLKTIEYPNSKL